MPKVDVKSAAETTLSISTQVEIKKQTSLLAGDKGLALRELEISFSTADKNSPSGRGALIVALIKRTPNLTELTLNFSGWLHTHDNCLGDSLIDALCALKDLESFHHGRTTSARTDFGQYTLMKLVSSWPKLRHLYLSGDSNGYGSAEEMAALPAAVCPLETVTFERCMANYDTLAPMFAGSSQSFRSLEAWTRRQVSIDAILLPVLPSIESIKLGGCDHPTPSFIIEHLSRAPKLDSISLGGNDDDRGDVRKAFAKALAEEGSFPSLAILSYPGQSGTYKTGRGRSVREHEYEGEDELRKAARARNIRAYIASDLEYKVEGSQRRAGFAAMSRRGW